MVQNPPTQILQNSHTILFILSHVVSQITKFSQQIAQKSHTSRTKLTHKSRNNRTKFSHTYHKIKKQK